MLLIPGHFLAPAPNAADSDQVVSEPRVLRLVLDPKYLTPFQTRQTPSALSVSPVLAVENFLIFHNRPNSRLPWFGKRVRSVPGQEGSADGRTTGTILEEKEGCRL